MKALITGANRGIGLSLVKTYLDLNYSVIAAVRDAKSISPQLEELQSRFKNLIIIELDLIDPQSISNFDIHWDECSLDLLINNAGVIDRSTCDSVTGDQMHQLFQVNAVAPLLIFKKVLSRLVLSSRPRVINITSRVGSIGDNSSGGKIAYRTSKAALNMITKTLSIEYPEIIFLGLHPGRISTRMVDFNGDMSPDECVSHLVPIIENSKLEMSGSFIHRDGYSLPF